MLNRREFLAVGIGAALATRAGAAPGDTMRYAMSGHQFTPLLPHPETGFKMAARYGYHGIEPFQNDVPNLIETLHASLKHRSRERRRNDDYQAA